MARLQLKRDVFNRCRERSVLSDKDKEAVDRLNEVGGGKGAVAASVHDFPLSFLRGLLDDARLTGNQRAVIAMQVYGMTKGSVDREEIYHTKVSSPVEYGSTFALLGGHTANCEMFLNGRWYPVTLGVQFLNDGENRARGAMLFTNVTMCETSFYVGHNIHSDLFLDESGNRRERSILEILQQFGYRPLQTSPADFNLKLLRAERAAREHGQMNEVCGPVLTDSRGYWCTRFASRALGTPEAPRKVVIEPELEVDEDSRNYYSPYGQSDQAQSRLPFVRVFSLDMKMYAYVDVDDLHPHEFDSDAMRRLHLPPEMLGVLSRVFDTPVEQLFGDLINGKHGGVVILASGNPGVGKTLTAEVYAEQTQRPLYVLELGELGTSAQDVEQNLRKVFARVARWNAVLQFDECEIFLSQRGKDLERSAIVGIFLRLLDYYQGILFLTTNRSDVIDHAVRSRVMLRLDYPDLDVAARARIWESMFEAADLDLVDGMMEDLAERDINGRQIRNLTRLAKILHPEGEVTVRQMEDVLQYGCS